MKHAATPLLLAIPLVSSCASAARTSDAATEARTIGLPASALAGAVRALETLDAVRPAGALLQVRALEGDTLFGRESGVESVRVFLHLTLYAETNTAARQAFDQLLLALEVEGRATARVEPASSERVGRVMAELDWDPPGREDLVSYSDVIRLELAPGRSSAEPQAGSAEAQAGSAPASGPPPYDTLSSYVRGIAARERIGEVDLFVSAAGVVRGVNDHRFRIQERSESARHTLSEIGGFLSALELSSPAARLTKLKIERSQHEPDVHVDRGWTFQAELSLRTRDEAEPRAAAAGSASAQR